MISETLIKTLMKAVDFEKLQTNLMSDPRVNEAMEIARTIRDDFATIKIQNAEIISRLDAANTVADITPAKRKPRVTEIPTIEDQRT